MANHNLNPVREQLRAEILAALAEDKAPMTTSALYHACPSATSSEEVSRVAYELRKKNLIADGGKVPHPRGTPVNSYILADPYLAASKPIKVEPPIKKSRQPAKKRKPAPGHPFTVSIKPQDAHDGLPRVTRDLPQHLQSTAPQLAAEGINHHILETAMSEDPLSYTPDPDAFLSEPLEPEAEEDIDSDLVDALIQLANIEPETQMISESTLAIVHAMANNDDPADMASANVGEIAAAMGKRQEVKADYDLTDLAPKKICKCLKINSLPPLPEGYVYGGIKVWIEAKHDVGHISISTHDEGGGPFCSLKATGHLSFDTGDMVAIGRVSDALIKLHQEMIHE